jgi:hypothetical protein
MMHQIYAVRLDDKTDFWFGSEKSADEFQRDMLLIISELKNLDPYTIGQGYRRRMTESGYIPVEALVTDSFKAKMVHTRSRIIPGD